MTRPHRPMVTLRCACGAEWSACDPGTVEQTTADDGRTVLLYAIPAVAQKVWCDSCWPWIKNRKAATS